MNRGGVAMTKQFSIGPSIIPSAHGLCFAATMNRKGRTRSVFIDSKAVLIIFSSTFVDFMFRRLRSKANPPNLSSESNRSHVDFLSFPDDNATSHVSGDSNVPSIRDFQSFSCSGVAGFA